MGINPIKISSLKVFVDSDLLHAFSAVFILCYLLFFNLPQYQRLLHPLSSFFFPKYSANPEYSIFSLLSFFEAEPVPGKLRKGTPVGVFHWLKLVVHSSSEGGKISSCWQVN